MKILSRPVEMIAWFNEGGQPNPVKFKLNSGEENTIIIKVDKVLFKEKERIAGNFIYIYRCQSLINNAIATYELKFDISSCKWLLYKM